MSFIVLVSLSKFTLYDAVFIANKKQCNRLLKNRVMSLMSENIVPGSQGKVFGTNAKNRDDLKRIKNHLLTMQGVKDVVVDLDAFPAEITIYSYVVLSVDEIQKRVMEVGFHVVPKGAFA